MSEALVTTLILLSVFMLVETLYRKALQLHLRKKDIERSERVAIDKADERRQRKMARNKVIAQKAQDKADEREIEQMWGRILANKRSV